MLQFLLEIFTFVFLLLVLFGCVVAGRTFGKAQLKKHPQHKLELVTAAESAVFGLLALLIAFTFSSAYQRLEMRKMHIMEEANIFSTAYDYIDFAPLKYQATMRQDLRDFLDLQIKAYHEMASLDKLAWDCKCIKDAQNKAWKTIILASEENSNPSLAQTTVEVMTRMFEVSYIGIKLSRVHAPVLIFVLMISMASLGAFLIGYDSAENREKRHIHMLCYVLLTSLTIYVILNLEFPRVGVIHLNVFDQMLIDVRSHMGTE